MSSSIPSAPMSSLKEILNLDKAEWVFQRLLEAVEAHSSELAALRRDVATKARSDETIGMCNEIHDQLTALERRVGATEAAVTLPEQRLRRSGSAQVAGSCLTVGEAVEANGQALREAMALLKGKAGRDELVAKGEELEACVRERERAVRKWGVGHEFADSLGRAQRGLAEQLAAVQGVLTTKLDRAELDNMQAACSKVSSVSEFLEDTAERVSKLEAGLDAAELERRQREAEIEETVQGLRSELSGKADEHPSGEVARDLAELRRAFLEETSSGRRQLRALKDGTIDLKKTLGGLSTSCGERLSILETCLEGAATKEELAMKVDRANISTKESLEALRADCALRAKQSTFSKLRATVSSLEAEHSKTRKSSDIAARFIDWFSSRGEAYEHNLAAVEKHIENMAIRAVGSRASPAKGALDEARRARISARSGGGIG
ncbi:unnamed protein product, partial [Ascophyllum nodosum]